MKHSSFFGLSMAAVFALGSAACNGETLDGGSSEPGAASSSSGSPSGSTPGGSSEDIPDRPVEGTIGGRPFSAKSIDLVYSTKQEQWFLTLRNYDAPCGISKDSPNAEEALLVTIGQIEPKAGTVSIAYADGHGAAFQIGVYDTADKADVRTVSAGLLRLDAWSDVAGTQVTGALRLSGEDSHVAGKFTAVVCAAR